MPGIKVIGGTLKGAPLVAPEGRQVRPTAARVREAIANILRNEIAGAFVLDLFAGTGAIGIEAVSRGAASAVFIDNSPESLSVIKKNIGRCGLEEKTRVICCDPSMDLSCLAVAERKFDLVFMDPPYKKDVIGNTLVNLHECGMLQAGATVVVERPSKQASAVWQSDVLDYFEHIDNRKYGKAQVSFFRYSN